VLTVSLVNAEQMGEGSCQLPWGQQWSMHACAHMCRGSKGPALWMVQCGSSAHKHLLTHYIHKMVLAGQMDKGRDTHGLQGPLWSS
jgi:hypothetical protein